MRRNWQQDPERGLWLPDRRVMPYAPRAPEWGGGLGPRRAVAPSAGVSVLQVQATGNNASGAGGPYNWFVPTSNLTPGSTLVIGAWNDAGTDGWTTVADATNGSWTKTLAYNGSSSGYLFWWTLKNNSSSGQPQVTLTFTDTTNKHNGVFIEIGGANTTAPVETTAHYETSYGDPIFTGSVTTSNTDIILGFAANSAKNSGLGSAGAGAGYTLVNFTGDMDFTGLLYTAASVAAGTYNPAYASTLNAFSGITMAIQP